MLVISPESAGGSKAAAAVGAIVIYVPESLPFLFLVSTKRVCHVPLVAWTGRRTHERKRDTNTLVPIVAHDAGRVAASTVHRMRL